jgi:uncharacterized protein YjdB
VPVARVALTPAVFSVKANKGRGASEERIVAAVYDAANNPLSGRTCTWTSSNPAVLALAEVAPLEATVRGDAVGVATVTATCEGKSGTASATVAP